MTVLSPTPTEGRFSRLPIYLNVVVDPEIDPLPILDASNRIPSLIFTDERSRVTVQLQPSARAAQWLYALGAALNRLAREVEESSR